LIVSRIVLDALKDLKMAYPKTSEKRRQELQAIRKELAKRSNSKHEDAALCGHPRAERPNKCLRHAHRPAVSFGLGLCQEPDEAISVSASFGPQLWRL